jgi:hypothetical protein
VGRGATWRPGRHPARGPARWGRWLQRFSTRQPDGVRHNGPRGTGGPGCDSVARAASGSSAQAAAAAVLAKAAIVVAGAPRRWGL